MIIYQDKYQLLTKRQYEAQHLLFQKMIYLSKFKKFTFLRTTQINQTISHVVGKTLQTPIHMHVAPCFQKIVQKYPNKNALNSYEQNRSFTYSQLYQEALSIATSFIKLLKLKPKDRIGIYSYNKWEWYVVQLAASLADLILVNINPAYLSQQLGYTIDKVGLKVLITSESFKHSNYLQIIQKLVPQITHSSVDPLNLRSKRFPNLHSVVKIGSNHRRTGFLNFSDLQMLGDRSIMPKYSDCHSEANIQFTSGTTGLPKAATLTHSNILNNAFVIGKRCNYNQDDNIVLPVPLYHCFGMIMGNLAALTRGAAVTYVGEGFNPKKTLEAITKYKGTALYGVPTMFIQYLRHYEGNESQYKLSHLRKGIVAGSLCPEILMEKIQNVLNLKEITNCYGMTETSPVSFQTSPSDSMKYKTTSVGTVLEGLEAKIIDSQGNTLPRGQTGQIAVKGWSVMSKYWGDQKATKSSIVEGWMRSGDLGVMDENGYLTIVGRIKDMIIRGGENVYPKQIEDFLRKMKQVIDVQVVGVSDEKFGEQIAAVIKVGSEATIKKEDVLKFCKGHIAHYKIPKFVKMVSDFPMTVTGKPQKYIIRNDLEKQMKQKGLFQYVIR